METTAISNNLTQINSVEKKKINVGYKVYPTAEETSKTANCDTYENREFAEKIKGQMKDRISSLNSPNILDIKGKPVSDSPNYLQFSKRTVVGRDGSTFQMGILQQL